MAESRRKGAGRPKGRQVVNVKWVDGKISRLPTSQTFDDLLSDPHLLMTDFKPSFDLVGHEEVTITETPFSSLTTQQLCNLLPILNDNCFVEAQTANELQEVFEGKRTAKVRNIGILAYILKKLAQRGLICSDWQLQAEANKMFVSAKETPIKAKRLADYLSNFMEQTGAYDNYYSVDDIPPTYKAKLRLKEQIDDVVTSL